MEDKIENITCRVRTINKKDNDVEFVLQPQYIDDNIHDAIIDILENETKREILHARVMVSKGGESSLIVVVAKCLAIMLLVSYERVIQYIKDDIELVSKIRYTLGFQDEKFFKENKDIIFGGEVTTDDFIISDEGIKIGSTKTSKKMSRDVSKAYLSVSETASSDMLFIDTEGLSQISAPQSSAKKIVPDSYFKKLYESFFPEQMAIYKSIIQPTQKYTIYLTSGTAGSGKSVLSISAFMYKLNQLYLEAIKNSIPVKTLSIFVFGRSLQAIHNTVVPTVIKWFSPLVKPPHRNATHMNIGGVVISFISLDSSSSIESIRGVNAILCYVDEATVMRNSDLTAILTRLRSGIPNFHPQIILSSNYSFKRSTPAKIEENATGLSALINHVQAKSNPYLEAGYIDRLSSAIDRNSIGYRIHVLGQHVDVESFSNIYSLSEKNIIEETKPLVSSTYLSHVYVGVDVGSTNPLTYVALAVFKFFSNDKTPLCQVIDNLYYPKYHSQYTTREMYDNDISLFIQQFSQQTKVTIIFPHDAVDKYHHYRRLLESARVSVIKTKPRDVMLGIAKIKYLLLHGMLEIKETCSELINEFHNYSYESKPNLDSEFDRNPVENKPRKENDHGLDALRYAVESSCIMDDIVSKIDEGDLFNKDKKASEKSILDALTI